MSMHLSDSNDMIYSASSSTSTRTRLEYLLMGVNIALGIAVLGFIIGVASIRSKVDNEMQEIIDLENEIAQCKALLSTTPFVSSTPSTGVTDDQLRSFTETLLTADGNNVGDQIKVDHKNITSGEYMRNFFTSVSETALSGPTFLSLIDLQKAYTPYVNISEKLNETAIQAFLKETLNTAVMKLTRDFLNEHGIYTGDLRTKIREMWFDLYSRGANKTILSSSGFEHVFVGDIENTKVLGFHNWVFFYNQEQAKNLIYKGSHKSIYLEEKGEVTSTKFKWLNASKPISGMFIGSSPEFDLAVYTVCSLTRPGTLCPVQLKNQMFKIQTYTKKQENKTLVVTAYPVL